MKQPMAGRGPHVLVFALLGMALLSPGVFAQRELKDIPDPDPELERRTFIVADGFEVNLFAADPQMAKPIQINFDDRGRLWVASSEIYPHIKPGEAPHDKVLVIEDSDHDGRADKTSVFADGLLIPTGVIAGDGGAYVVNSTELLHLRDSDGDGKADTRRVVLSGFGTEDTHHLLHTLRWGHDGCLYMNQSIYIHSHVETPHGVKRLNGGGIWRFRPETMQLDVLCYGFVNAWGHHFDAWGQSFATDGAYHEGINYVFPGSVFVTAPGATRLVAGLNPGSPKHCGLEIVSGRHMPDDWQGNMITNDFRAHRVCRFVVTEDGSGYASRQEVEVIKSSHVAFRPIDAKMGPDGALYIADWYNPIIQHGEVDFRDPRRDHVHGRIWRVSAKGRPTLKLPDFNGATNEQLLEMLKQPEDWVRLHAKLEMKKRDQSKLLQEITTWVQNLDRMDPQFEHHCVEGLWAFETLDLAHHRYLKDFFLKLKDPRARAAALRAGAHWITEMREPFGKAIIRPDIEELFRLGVSDDHPRIRLEAVRGLALLPTARSADVAMRVLDKPMDRFLDFALWQTMRDLEAHWLPEVQQGKLDFDGNVDRMLFALRAVASPKIVQPLITLIRSSTLQTKQLNEVLTLITTHGGAPELSAILDLVVDRNSSLNETARAELLNGLVATSQSRRVQPAGDLLRIKPLLSHSSATLRAAAARAVGAWKVESLRHEIVSLANASNDNSKGQAVSHGAIEGLVLLGGKASISTLENLAFSKRPYLIRQSAVSALASLDVNSAAKHTVELLVEAPNEMPPGDVVAALLAQKNGPEALTRELGKKQLNPDVAKILLRSVQSAARPSPELLAAVRSAGKLADTGWKLTPQLQQALVTEVAEKGNAARGERIFRRAELQCQKCHAIAGAGGKVGSDLISLGATAPVDYIVESLLNPNAKVKEGYHSKLVVTDEGKVITGIPIRESATELVLRDAEDREVSIPIMMIEEKKDGRSLMPDGAVDLLTRAELVDLIRFLSELGKLGDYAVGNARVMRRWQTLIWTAEAHQRLNRTSHDTAATDDPALTWQPVYSQVSGTLPVEDLPQFQPHKDTDPTSFVRCQLDVTTAGTAQIEFNSIDGLSMWLDGRPLQIAPKLKLDLNPGIHTLTLDIRHKNRSEPLRLQLNDVVGSAAQVQFVSGK